MDRIDNKYGIHLTCNTWNHRNADSQITSRHATENKVIAPMKIFFYDHSNLQLPQGHRFPSQKYSMLLDEIRNQKILGEHELIQSIPATRDEVIVAHTKEYFDGIITGTIDPKIMRQIGLPWSKDLVERSLASVGGSLCAANEALVSGFSGNLGGGTHHAMADQGMGYCVFNDLAVVILNFLRLKKSCARPSLTWMFIREMGMRPY